MGRLERSCESQVSLSGVAVEKGLLGSGGWWVGITAREEFLAGWELSRRRERRLRSLAEETDQSLDVLGSRRQEELLANKL